MGQYFHLWYNFHSRHSLESWDNNSFSVLTIMYNKIMHPNISNGLEETDSHGFSSDLYTCAVAQAGRQADRQTHIQINKFNLKSYEKTKK